MKKLTLTDIMESLSSDNEDDATAALHEWFVDMATKANNEINGLNEDETGDEDESEADADADSVEESRVDELSTDTMRRYANKARKSRDNSDDDEVVGRRVAGLGMVADKARKERSKPQYESDDMDDTSEFGHDTDEAVVGNSDEDVFEVAEDATIEAEHTESGSRDVELDNSDAVFSWVKLPDGFQGEEIPDEIAAQLVQLGAVGMFGDFEWAGILEGQNGIQIAYAAYTLANDHREDDQEGDGFGEGVTEAELIADLSEAFKGLETVSDKLQNQEGAQVGEQGKVPVNTKSTLPNVKAKDRVGGKAVEIKNDQHKGFEREKAPKTKDVSVAASGSRVDQKEVKVKTSALLNKVDGKINTTSPISGKGAKGIKK